MPKRDSAQDAELLLEPFEPSQVKLFQALRKRLKRRVPGLNELVYSYPKQESVVIAFSTSGKGYEALYSLSVNPEGIKLYLAQGPRLKQWDPEQLLQGKGKAVRFVPLSSMKEFEAPAIQSLLDAVENLAQAPAKTKGPRK